MGCREWQRWVREHEKKLTLRKTDFFVIEKYVKDVKQGQKLTPDLLGSVISPTCLVKEELRLILFQINLFSTK